MSNAYVFDSEKEEGIGEYLAVGHTSMGVIIWSIDQGEVMEQIITLNSMDLKELLALAEASE